jgi:methionyl-tRNA formyltransferase
MDAALVRGVLEAGHEVVGWVGDGRQARVPTRLAVPMASAVFEPRTSALGLSVWHRIPRLWFRGDARADAALLRSVAPDLLLSGDFSMIFKAPVLEVPAIGAVNAHWSLLPHHRGPCPSTAVLLAGDSESGLTFHVLTARIDAGDILLQRSFPLRPRDTALSVYCRAAELAAEEVSPLLAGIAANGLVGTPQDLAVGSYRRVPKRAEVRLDLTRPAVELDRMVRAVVSPMAWFEVGDQVVHVSHTMPDDTAVDAKAGTVLSNRPRVRVATGRGSLLLDVAYSWRPVPWLWPAPWNRPAVGSLVGVP